jgi:phosphatidate cytidylyltransferase
MTDDSWRRRRDEDEDFGPPLFGDDPTDEMSRSELSFGSGDTGPLPHWTAPPTGEIGRVGTSNAGDDVDVWSEFSDEAPNWSDSPADDITGAYDTTSAGFDDTVDEPPAEARREPSRITIGTDPTGDGSRPVPRRARSGDTRGNARPRGAVTHTGGTGGRDMPTAIAMGVLLAAAFLAVVLFLPTFVAAVVVTLVVGLAAVEYFDKVTERSYRPATIAGIVACVTLPVAAYWEGERTLPLVLVLAFGVAAVTFIGGPGLEQAPMPNMAITTLGVMWIGLLGSFGALILRESTRAGGIPVAAGFSSSSVGTDTLVLLAIAVVANDVGALAVGSALGKTPLRAWVSPNKSVEGLCGGALATFLVMVLINTTNRSNTWNSLGDMLWLAAVVSVAAPIGDLIESMFKRNLDVKDFGSIVRGHGGVLDRFDGFLTTLPAVYYLMQVLQPWAT